SALLVVVLVEGGIGAAVEAVVAQGIAEAQGVLAHRMGLQQLLDQLTVALHNGLHQQLVALLLGGLGGVADDAVIQVVLLQQREGALSAVELPAVRGLAGSHLPLGVHQG
ncbi:NTP pyrophosphohydrolase MazG putative catalytic core domain-containing protein, partial [Dysosmobacter welbionis]